MIQEGLHHLHLRERTHKDMQPYPHPVRWKRRLDAAMYVVGVVAPLALIPQILQVWLYRNSAGIAVPTWFMFAAVNILWMIYGVVHRARVIVVSNIMLLVFNTLVAVGAMIF